MIGGFQEVAHVYPISLDRWAIDIQQDEDREHPVQSGVAASPNIVIVRAFRFLGERYDVVPRVERHSGDAG
jgi:hypothetical protein